LSYPPCETPRMKDAVLSEIGLCVAQPSRMRVRAWCQSSVATPGLRLSRRLEVVNHPRHQVSGQPSPCSRISCISWLKISPLLPLFNPKNLQKMPGIRVNPTTSEIFFWSLPPRQTYLDCLRFSAAFIQRFPRSTRLPSTKRHPSPNQESFKIAHPVRHGLAKVDFQVERTGTQRTFLLLRRL